MSNQVLGLFNNEPRLNYPSTQPPGVDQALAGVTSVPLQAPQGGGGGAAMPGPQVEGLFGGGLRGAAAGMGAANQMGPSYDGPSAAVNVGTATLEGAVAGGLSGGPVGAVAGGVLGLATSGINAWMQVGAENKRKAQIDALIAELKQKQTFKDAQGRADDLGQLKYDRKQAEFQKAWGLTLAKRDDITNLINDNSTLRSNYIKTGTRSQYA
jgi:hypothetical protein